VATLYAKQKMYQAPLFMVFLGRAILGRRVNTLTAEPSVIRPINRFGTPNGERRKKFMTNDGRCDITILNEGFVRLI
jgi:hypothetical protein